MMRNLTKETLLLKGPHPLKNEYERCKKSLQLSQFQRNILIGTLLGDAHLEAHGKIPSFRYYFNQKESQYAYVNFIFSCFLDWCSMKEPLIAKSGVDTQGNITKFFYFRTCTHPSFAFYANQFYITETNIRRKVIPKLFSKWLNPQVLAYWFMDDGCRDDFGYILNTQNFSLAEQEILAKALGRKFKFEVNIHKDRDNYRLYITAKSRASFTQIVKPFILPSFEYKLFPSD